MKTKHYMEILFSRILYICIFVTIQAATVGIMFAFCFDKLPYFYIACTVLSLFAAVHILNKNNNPASKLPWLITISVAPIFGGLLYLMFGSHIMNRHLSGISKIFAQKHSSLFSAVSAPQIPEPAAALQSDYITRCAHCPAYISGGTLRYYSSGEALFPDMLAVLRGATRYIFLEYFVIGEGVFWNAVLDVLKEKAQSGVTVRVLYDDFGCIPTLPRRYDRELRKYGIEACAFNRFTSILSPRANNRDHRKLCIADGVYVFTGGVNLADEYINERKRFGYWKDTAVLLDGAAAWSFTVQFLSVWEFVTKQKQEPGQYLPPALPLPQNACGAVQPFSDIPMDEELVGRNVYFNLITRATRYLWITTPYLIPDYEILTALCNAAKSGVDVRIITPHIPDKRSVWFLTRSYYKPLMDAGVHVCEFTPGFMHAKMMLSDDAVAVIGSINLDYRSLYHHMECGVWMHKTAVLPAIRADFEETFPLCHEITYADLGHLTAAKRLWLSILRTFAPLI